MQVLRKKVLAKNKSVTLVAVVPKDVKNYSYVATTGKAEYILTLWQGDKKTGFHDRLESFTFEHTQAGLTEALGKFNSIVTAGK